MKKLMLSSAVVAALVLGAAMPAQAATLLGVQAGADAWFANGNVSNHSDFDTIPTSYFVSVEHFIPLVPNFRLSYNNINNGTVAFNQMDYTAYYEILDNDLISLDVGLTASKFNAGKVSKEHFDNWQPSVYGHAVVGIPMTPLSAFTTINAGHFDGSRTFDGLLGVQWTLPIPVVDLNLRAGYRKMDYKFDSINAGTIKLDGWFAGVSIDI